MSTPRRERRKTAGKRMNDLVGKAQEQDDEFWGHDTWADGSDSGNDSFHESDEDSVHRKDVFDSDFNDSESDNEKEEMAAADEEESALRKTERRAKRSGDKYVDIAKAGRELMAKKKGKGKKRLMGVGINAGIVLNLPSGQSPTHLASTSPKSVPQTVQSADLSNNNNNQLTGASSPKQVRPVTKTPRKSKVSKRLSSGGDSKNGAVPSKKLLRRKYKQEELLLEAVHETEPENRRWLLARKRVQDLADHDRDMMLLRDRSRSKVIEKYNSRRGCLITLTFPEMDSVPNILSRSNEAPPKTKPSYCAITGKRARYKDPLTNEAYYDAVAFKELRARHKAGLPLRQEPDLPISDAAQNGVVANKGTTEKTKGAGSSSVTTKEVKSADTSSQETPKRAPKKIKPEKVARTKIVKSTNATPSSTTQVTTTTTSTATSSSSFSPPKASNPAMGTSKDQSNQIPSEFETIDSSQTKVTDSADKTTSAAIANTGIIKRSDSNSDTGTDSKKSNPNRSPSRSSSRRWKPSSKMLENLICDDKRTALASCAFSTYSSSRVVAENGEETTEPNPPADQSTNELQETVTTATATSIASKEEDRKRKRDADEETVEPDKNSAIAIATADEKTPPT